MDVENFDTYVTSKGFLFSHEEKENLLQGVTYALERNRNNDIIKASKFLTLYQRYRNYKNAITYQTSNKNEYLIIKNQIKVLGFKLTESEVFTKSNGKSANNFEFKKGKESISLYASPTEFEINYHVDY